MRNTAQTLLDSWTEHLRDARPRKPRLLGAGTERRMKREAARAASVAEIYVFTPAAAEYSRQERRAIARSEAKADMRLELRAELAERRRRSKAAQRKRPKGARGVPSITYEHRVHLERLAISQATGTPYPDVMLNGRELSQLYRLHCQDSARNGKAA